MSPPRDSESRTTVSLLIGAYGAVIVLLAVFGHFGYMYKVLILPALVLTAVAIGRLRLFVRDWAIFLSAMFLADAIRGLIYACINRFDLPVYLNYVIRWESALLGGRTLPQILQAAWLGAREPGFPEKALVVIHASHFVFFLFFAFLVWLYRAEHFRRFQIAILLTIYVGMVVYVLVPTIPPWMAAQGFQAIDGVRQVATQVYNYSFPNLEQYFRTNPIAAMPSLHAAFPTVVMFTGFRHFGWRAWPAAVYGLLVYLAIAYLGEHYLLDIVAGILLALACCLAAYRINPVPLPRQTTTPRDGPERRPGLAFLVAVVLLLLAEAIGLWSTRHFLAVFAPDGGLATHGIWNLK